MVALQLLPPHRLHVAAQPVRPHVLHAADVFRSDLEAVLYGQERDFYTRFFQRKRGLSCLFWGKRGPRTAVILWGPYVGPVLL